MGCVACSGSAVACAGSASRKSKKWAFTAELDERFLQESAMVLEISRQAERDSIMAACIETKQLAVEEESIAEALAWSYEHGDVKKIAYAGCYDDWTYGSAIADEGDSRLFEPGFKNLDFDDSQEAIKLGGGDVVHLPPAQRLFPSRKANMKYGVLGKKRNKQSDSRAPAEGSTRSGKLVSKVHST